MTSGCNWQTTPPPCHEHSGAFISVSPVTFARASSSSPAFPDARRPPMTAYGTRGTNGSLKSEARESPHGSSEGRQRAFPSLPCVP